MTRSARLLPVAAFLLWGSHASAQDLGTAVRESYVTNLRMLEEVAESAVSELLIGFKSPGTTLLVVPESEHEANWFIENLVLSRLTDAGYAPFLKDVSAEKGPARGADSTLTGQDSTGASGTQDSTMAESTAADSSDALASSSPVDTLGAPLDPVPFPESDHVFRYRVVEFGVTYPEAHRKSPLGSRQVQRLARVNLTARLLEGDRERVLWGGKGDAAVSDVVPSGKLSLLEGDSPFTSPVPASKGLSGLVEPALVTGIVVGLIYLFYTNQN